MTKYQRTTPFYIDFFAVNFEVIIVITMLNFRQQQPVTYVQNLHCLKNVNKKLSLLLLELLCVLQPLPHNIATTSITLTLITQKRGWVPVKKRQHVQNSLTGQQKFRLPRSELFKFVNMATRLFLIQKSHYYLPSSTYNTMHF